MAVHCASVHTDTPVPSERADTTFEYRYVFPDRESAERGAAALRELHSAEVIDEGDGVRWEVWVTGPLPQHVVETIQAGASLEARQDAVLREMDQVWARIDELAQQAGGSWNASAVYLGD